MLAYHRAGFGRKMYTDYEIVCKVIYKQLSPLYRVEVLILLPPYAFADKHSRF